MGGSLNTSDAFLGFARAEIARTPLVYRSFDPANATHWASDDLQIAMERDILIARFVDDAGERIRSEIEDRLEAPTPMGIDAPTPDGAGDVTGRELNRVDGMRDGGESIRAADIRDDAVEIRSQVSSAQKQGNVSVQRSRRIREADTTGAGMLTKDGAERARSWSESVPLSPLRRD